MNNNNDNSTTSHKLNNTLKEFIVIIESTFNKEHKNYKDGNLKKFLMNLKILTIESSLKSTKIKNSNSVNNNNGLENINLVFDDNTFNYFSQIMRKLF